MSEKRRKKSCAKKRWCNGGGKKKQKTLLQARKMRKIDFLVWEIYSRASLLNLHLAVFMNFTRVYISFTLSTKRSLRNEFFICCRRPKTKTETWNSTNSPCQPVHKFNGGKCLMDSHEAISFKCDDSTRWLMAFQCCLLESSRENFLRQRVAKVLERNSRRYFNGNCDKVKPTLITRAMFAQWKRSCGKFKANSSSL